MNNNLISKRIIYWGCISIFKVTHAFQDDFTTTDRNPVSDESLRYNKRFFANAPFSYCDEDGIPDEWCTTIGLRVDQPTFTNLYIRENPHDNISYNVETKSMPFRKLSTLIEDYYLIPYQYNTKPFHVPTEGQLSWLIDNGYVPRESISTPYFVTHNKNNMDYVRIASIGRGFRDVAGPAEAARLYRLTTADVPDICQNSFCPHFRDMRSFVVKFRNSCDAVWNWRVEYTDSRGVRNEYQGYWQGEFTIPSGAYNIDVMARQATFHYSSIKNIQDTNRDHAALGNNECYQLTGGCTGYTLKNITPCNW